MREELLQEAFRKYGTPLYVFDLDILKEQTERIRAGFGPEINLCYAMKANPFLTGYMLSGQTASKSAPWENFGSAGDCGYHRKNYLFQVL